uniref:Uncharacterized protein n=1 Tax=Arundo donax TaxID=35708 RepID=A0A0A9GIT4_ARUDO
MSGIPWPPPNVCAKPVPIRPRNWSTEGGTAPAGSSSGQPKLSVLASSSLPPAAPQRSGVGSGAAPIPPAEDGGGRWEEEEG